VKPRSVSFILPICVISTATRYAPCTA
jgi:hypothetical protein